LISTVPVLIRLADVESVLDIGREHRAVQAVRSGVVRDGDASSSSE